MSTDGHNLLHFLVQDHSGNMEISTNYKSKYKRIPAGIISHFVEVLLEFFFFSSSYMIMNYKCFYRMRFRKIIIFDPFYIQMTLLLKMSFGYDDELLYISFLPYNFTNPSRCYPPFSRSYFCQCKYHR